MANQSYPVFIPETVSQKLILGKRRHQPIYIFGATGYGKTSVVKEFLSNRDYLYFSGNDLLHTPTIRKSGRKESAIVVIDDLFLVRYIDIQKRIIELCKRDDLWIILINRAPVPSWLLSCSVDSNMIVISEDDLRLTPVEIQKFFDYFELTLDDKVLALIDQTADGHGYIIHNLLLKMQEGFTYDENLIEHLQQSFVENLIANVLPAMELDILEFLMQVSVVKEFTLELAEHITGNSKVASLIQRIQESGNFLFKDGEIYHLRQQVIAALHVFAERIYGSDYLKEYYYNAGLFYETHDQSIDAMEMYEIAGYSARMRNILIRNARENPSVAFYYRFRKYYDALKEEDVENNPILMSALSMYYSVMIQPEKSEYWYIQLRTFSEHAHGSLKKEALSRLAYLDFGLPHRGTNGMLENIKDLYHLMTTKDFIIPEFSVTSNLPSVMNGGKDFSEWSKRDKELALIVGKPLSLILGRYGKGLVNEALGESLFEKGQDDFETFSYLNKAHFEAETAGKTEMLFAIVGQQVRMSLVHGDSSMAIDQLNSFRKRIDPKEFPGIASNLNALLCRIHLYQNEDFFIDEWLDEAPDENETFFTMERYRYLTKIRCYIKNADYMSAYSLTERMLFYSEKYYRHYIQIESKVLLSIICHRLGRPWREHFQKALELAYDYRFVRVISMEGVAVVPLLQESKKIWQKEKGAKKEWFNRVLSEAVKIGKYYPSYLSSNIVSGNDFSENAIRILKMQAEGYTAKQIADTIGISEATVKYHSSETYKKLQVKGKTEAVQKARSLKIL